MPLDFKCPECQAGLRVKDEHAGKKMKCPKCAKVISIPKPDDDVVEDVDVVEDEPRAEAEAGDPFQELDRPTSKKEKLEAAKAERGPNYGKYMPCPHCGAREAKKVNWTWWGSFYGPKLFHQVRCLECGGGFNGKSGDTNLIPAVLFVTIPLVLIVVLLFVIYFMLKRKGLI
jgi:predicted Zn finger-like uncharacterized protein